MTTKTLPQQARIVAGMIALGEHIAWGRDTELLIKLADQVEAITKERDALALGVDQWRVDYHELRLECDALIADVARLAARQKSFEKGVTDAGIYLKAERDALAAAGRLAMDVCVDLSGVRMNQMEYLSVLRVIAALEAAGVQ